jgi:RecB family endonuclease NucS
MAIFRVTDSAIEKVGETTFAQEKFLERRDLQRLVKADISILSPDLMVIKDEFGEWEDSKRRIDLLCLDKDAHLVVVELKRTEEGEYMDLQAIRCNGVEHDFRTANR